MASMSSHIGAVNGWWELLQRPCARKSLSASARVNRGNSVIQRKCGSFVTVCSPRESGEPIPSGECDQETDQGLELIQISGGASFLMQ